MSSIVYVLTNPAMPGIVKIGHTTQANPQVRMDQLYTTGVPLPFECAIAVEVEDGNAGEIENALHTAFGPHRVNPSREFFEIEVHQVEALLRVLPGRDITPRVNEETSPLGPEDQDAVKEFKARRALVTEQDFLDSLDDNGIPVFNRILAYGKQEGMRFNWGFKGFSMNLDLSGTRVALCFGYPPNCVYGQSIYTDLGYSVVQKANVPGTEVENLREVALGTGLFSPVGAGIELRCRLDRRLGETEVTALVQWLESLSGCVRRYVAIEESSEPEKVNQD
jgi:hypothetical protein